MARPLMIALFCDGRPGHEKQTMSVVAALKALTPLSVSTRIIPPARGIQRLRQGLRAFITPEHVTAKSIDLIIGAGSATHLPMIALKRQSRAKLVACMSPDPLLIRWFDLCLVPRHDAPPVRHNIFPTFGPPCFKISSADHDSLKGLILAGGVDPKSHNWQTDVFLSHINELLSCTPHIRWTVSSSPRTPADTAAQLARLAAENPRVRFFSAAETPKGWIEGAYQSHGQVWVTADSVSMVYEALTAGCRVGILPVEWKSPGNKFQKGIDDLKNQGLVIDFAQWRNNRRWPAALTPLDEAGRCALEILKRWWPERLV